MTVLVFIYWSGDFSAFQCICYEQLCLFCLDFCRLFLLYEVHTYLFCEMSVIINDMFLALVSGPGLVRGGRGNYHCLCGAFCNLTHSYSQCHRRCVAGESLYVNPTTSHLYVGNRFGYYLNFLASTSGHFRITS